MRKKQRPCSLADKAAIQVRFSEVDALRIVWHGNYVKYFEDGRESFGSRYNLSYLDILNNGYKAPIVQLNIDYKKPSTWGSKLTIETRYIASDAAKIIFDYIITDENNNVVACATTVQVFLNEANELEINNPDFYVKWKQKWGVK